MAPGDPELLPGDPAGVVRLAWSLTVYGDLLHDAGDGLRRIDTADGWSGDAAEQFRSAYRTQPQQWLQAGDCFHTAADALRRYSDTLTWAQGQATAAARQWDEAQRATHDAAAQYERAAAAGPVGPFADPGDGARAAARATLDRARAQLTAAGDTAAQVVERARDQAPEAPGLLDRAGSAAADVGGALVRGVESFGNAALHHPEAVLTTLAGAGLVAVSAVGETAGVALDLTGVGALAGAPLNVVSAAGIATGITLAGAGLADLTYHATTDDNVGADGTDAGKAPPAAPVLGPKWDDVVSAKPNPADVHVGDLDRIHIIDGDPVDPLSGGHAPGTGRPGKNEFPDTELWTDDHIVTTIEDVARNPDRPPELDARSGNYRFTGTRDGVEIEGYVTPTGAIKTGYPVRGEGVTVNDANGRPTPLPP